MACAALLLSLHCVAADRLLILATTTHIAALVREIGGGRVRTVTAVKGGICPGNFDTDPATVKNMAAAEMILHHPWETWLQKLTALTGNTAVESVAVEPAGSWMIPSNNQAAAGMVCAALSAKLPGDEAYFKKNLAAYLHTVAAAGAQAQKEMEPYRGATVVCARHQADFLAWLGFDVVGSYGAADDLTAAGMARLVDAARCAHARLVVDNRQSGADAGRQIAADAGCRHVTLSSFPARDSYIDTLNENIALLRNALHE